MNQAYSWFSYIAKTIFNKFGWMEPFDGLVMPVCGKACCVGYTNSQHVDVHISNWTQKVL